MTNLPTKSRNTVRIRTKPPGGPRQFQTPNGFEFIEQQDRKRITIIFGGGPRSWRFIYLDGRPREMGLGAIEAADAMVKAANVAVEATARCATARSRCSCAGTSGP